MERTEVVRLIKANWPDERYGGLREALNIAIADVEAAAKAQDTIAVLRRVGEYFDGQELTDFDAQFGAVLGEVRDVLRRHK
jgi:hypothetical protein